MKTQRKNISTILEGEVVLQGRLPEEAISALRELVPLGLGPTLHLSTATYYLVTLAKLCNFSKLHSAHL